ncbi:MAG: hypothetical protein ACK5QV_18885, partial [Dolichospermum sp.]
TITGHTKRTNRPLWANCGLKDKNLSSYTIALTYAIALTYYNQTTTNKYNGQVGKTKSNGAKTDTKDRTG